MSPKNARDTLVYFLSVLTMPQMQETACIQLKLAGNNDDYVRILGKCSALVEALKTNHLQMTHYIQKLNMNFMGTTYENKTERNWINYINKTNVIIKRTSNRFIIKITKN